MDLVGSFVVRIADTTDTSSFAMSHPIFERVGVMLRVSYGWVSVFVLVLDVPRDKQALAMFDQFASADCVLHGDVRRVALREGSLVAIARDVLRAWRDGVVKLRAAA